MVLPTWIPDALRSEQKICHQRYWRCVEAQHVTSTMQLVDTLDEQQLLEEILEETKPSLPVECERLHYLYTTPFRYSLYPSGSRFRRSGHTPGVYYVSEQITTAVAETAFHLLLFYIDSPDTPFPTQPSEHTVFDVTVKTDTAIDLTDVPFSTVQNLWTHPINYETCQQLEETARTENIELIHYHSVRDPKQQINAAILSCNAFAANTPRRFHSWRLLFNHAGIHATSILNGLNLSIPPQTWDNDPRLQEFKWHSTD